MMSGLLLRSVLSPSPTDRFSHMYTHIQPDHDRPSPLEDELVPNKPFVPVALLQTACPFATPAAYWGE